MTRASSPQDDECHHGWRHDGSPGDHCDECITDDVERETVAKICAWLRSYNDFARRSDIASRIESMEWKSFEAR